MVKKLALRDISITAQKTKMTELPPDATQQKAAKRNIIFKAKARSTPKHEK